MAATQANPNTTTHLLVPLQLSGNTTEYPTLASAGAHLYNEAVEIVLGILATKRKFSNRIVGRLGERTGLATCGERPPVSCTRWCELGPGHTAKVTALVV